MNYYKKNGIKIKIMGNIKNITPYQINLIDKVIDIRKKNGYTVTSFAKELGIPRQLYKDIENKKKCLLMSMIYNIKKKFFIDLLDD